MSIESIEETALHARKALGLLTEGETAKILDVEVTTLATWRGQRKGPEHVKLGKAVFYTVPLIQKWIEKSYTDQQSTKQDLKEAA
jgi:hypothetical protein